MNKFVIIILTIFLISQVISVPAQITTQATTATATREEALTIANNWIYLIIQTTGDWGGYDTVEISDIQEFKRGDRLLGYLCDVEPKGFIIISLYKGLAPVKAYSTKSDMDPESAKGFTDLIKRCMDSIIIAIEQKIGPIEKANPQDIDNILEINYNQAWEELELDIETYKEKLQYGDGDRDFQEGEVMLSTSWHQSDPYNASCPDGDGGRTIVGCVATAGAQIMKFWDWPPYGVGSHSYTWDGDQSCGGSVGGGILNATFSDTYDWPNISNRYVWDFVQTRWEDENGEPLTQTHIDAVAELGYEVGVAVEMDYGVCSSGAWTFNMEGVYEDHYRYSLACRRVNRNSYNSTNWYNLMKINFMRNRPIQYRISGHSLVADGWREIGMPITRQYHMNYGWDDGFNAWYTLDAHPGYNINEDYLLEKIYPAQAIGSLLQGTYLKQSFPYRYFDRNANGDSATFNSGQFLQFLPNVTVSCNSISGGYIRFIGENIDPSFNTLLFSRGNQSKGIKIINGGLRLYENAGIKFD